MFLKRRNDFATIYYIDFIFKKMSILKDIFPHIRKDYLEKMILNQNVLFKKGVILIYKKYSRKVKIGNNSVAKKGDYILHQILNTQQGNGNATIVMKYFCKNKNVFLTVRESNSKAINFYIKNGFAKIGDIYWKNKTIKGIVMYKNKRR